MKTTALAAALLFAHGEATESTVIAAERLGLVLGALDATMPGFFLLNAATGLAELVSIGPNAPAALLTSIAANGATAFLIIMAMTFGLILPRMLFERVMPAPA